MYPEEFIRPMRQELTRIGFRELSTPQDVDAALKSETRTTLVVVNSMCGCAAGKARPAIARALSNAARPEVLLTVFAGQDAAATERARSYITGYPPSSPSIALFRDGKLAFMMERREIESRDAFAIAADLVSAFDRFCAPTKTSA
ncbi:MAG TPA: BrxA/BrxB family bacilliredoxin [Verrucomicrobiae bacterium]|nr:BrxA/BrxB family bacilliredoxin [Verrucomicrobiae bacterium]